MDKIQVRIVLVCLLLSGCTTYNIDQSTVSVQIESPRTVYTKPVRDPNNPYKGMIK